MLPARGQTLAPFPVRLDFAPEGPRRASRYPASFVPATTAASPSTMIPSSRTDAAEIVRVKLPADGVPVSAAELGVVPTAGIVTGVITGGAVMTLTGLIRDGLATPGVVGWTAGVTTTAGTLLGAATGEGVLTADWIAAGVVAAAVGPMTVTVPLAVGSAVMGGLVEASAVAVRVTDVTEVAPEATWICACISSDAGVTGVAIDPIVHVADPSPPGQRPVNTGTSPCGAPVSVTDTLDAGPFSAQI
jgi:hypothetical protein